jgi:hypothetical protein
MATKIQVVFYSMYGHIYRMAEAIVAGARKVAGTDYPTLAQERGEEPKPCVDERWR